LRPSRAFKPRPPLLQRTGSSVRPATVEPTREAAMGRHGRLLAVLALAAWAGAVVGRERAEAWELLLKYQRPAKGLKLPEKSSHLRRLVLSAFERG